MKRLLFLLSALAFLFVFALSATATFAQGTTTRLAETSVTIPANGEVTLDYQAFCLDFGEPFPEAFGTPTARADDDILKVVKTAILDGTADDDPLSVNLAIWSLRENKTPLALYPNLDSDVNERTNDLLERSQDQTVDPLANNLGIPLNQAVADGQVEVTDANFQPDTSAPVADPADQPYHGSGTMTIRNLTNEEIEIYYAFGTILQASDEGDQDLVTYATELEQVATPTPAATATTAATATAQATATTAATATVQVEATATPQAPTTVPTTGTGDNAFLLVVGGLAIMLSAIAYQYVRVTRS